jgi:hypothetical protein
VEKRPVECDTRISRSRRPCYMCVTVTIITNNPTVSPILLSTKHPPAHTQTCEQYTYLWTKLICRFHFHFSLDEFLWCHWLFSNRLFLCLEEGRVWII